MVLFFIAVRTRPAQTWSSVDDYANTDSTKE